MVRDPLIRLVEFNGLWVVINPGEKPHIVLLSVSYWLKHRYGNDRGLHIPAIRNGLR